MTAAAVLAALRTAGVRVRLDGDGSVRLDAPHPPPPGLLALARVQRDAIAALLWGADATRLAPAHGASVRLPPSWSDTAATPAPGALCYCCSGCRWWTEARAPSGWRCWRCYPPLHLAPEHVREVRT